MLVTTTGSIELGNNVGGANCLVNHYYGSNVSGLCLSVQRFFNPGIANKNQSSRLKVKIHNLRVVALLKLLNVLSPRLADSISHVFNVLWVFGKLAGMESNQIFSGDPEILWRGEVGCF